MEGQSTCRVDDIVCIASELLAKWHSQSESHAVDTPGEAPSLLLYDPQSTWDDFGDD